MRARHVIAAGAVVAATALMTAACGSSSSSSSAGGSAGSGSSSGSANWATCASLSQCGGMGALVAQAKKEGQLNVITLPSNWANYGTIMADFTKQYGIHITDENPDGSSQDELNAIAQLKGQSREPDVVDVGTAFAVKGDQSSDWAPYQVQTWSNIPADAKAANGDWFADYGGYVAIGYNPAKVKVAPTSFKSLLNPMYKNQVGINGNPTEAGAAFAAVYAAALANGGSLSNIAPGVSYFKQLHQVGNFVPVTGSATTVQSGQTPILIWWDYLLASEVKSQIPGFKIVIPSDAQYEAYYDQAISKYSPDPAAARLWEEYLYSTSGQNLWLAGQTRPIELPTLVSASTENQSAYSALPALPSGSTASLASTTQQAAAETIVSQQWSSVGG